MPYFRCMKKLIIDWSHIPTYTTIMAIFAGSSILSIASVGRKLLKRELNPTGWALNFAALGFVLTLAGGHMALTWPIVTFPFDNIVFGETSLGLGVLDLALAGYFWTKKASIGDANIPVETVSKELLPFRIVLSGLGLGLIAIALAAFRYKFFIAPKEEPIGGDFAVQHPIGENIGISTMFLCTGLAAILAVLFLTDFSSGKNRVRWYHIANYTLLRLAGWFFLLTGAIVFYTHIGLISNTSPPH